MPLFVEALHHICDDIDTLFLYFIDSYLMGNHEFFPMGMSQAAKKDTMA